MFQLDKWSIFSQFRVLDLLLRSVSQEKSRFYIPEEKDRYLITNIRLILYLHSSSDPILSICRINFHYWTSIYMPAMRVNIANNF